MLGFMQMKTLQKFASVHANVHNHFNSERHLVDRPTYKLLRSADLTECTASWPDPPQSKSEFCQSEIWAH
jgi:putative transposase